MAENPLLSHRRLQELHALMLRCRDLERQNRFAPAMSREALLAATAIQAEPGDVLVGEPEDVSVDQLVAKSQSTQKAAKAAQPHAPAAFHLITAAGIARGLQAAGKGVCFVFASSSIKDTSWAEALTYAQTARLPLIVLYSDLTGTAKARQKTTLPTVSKLCKGLHLPVLTVDGEDAIAVYRVAQESILRARHGDGPAVVWCSLNRRKNISKSESKPIAHMEQYLAVRGLKPLKRFS